MCKILCADCQSQFVEAAHHCVCQHPSLWPYTPGGQRDEASSFTSAASSWHRPSASRGTRVAAAHRGRQEAASVPEQVRAPAAAAAVQAADSASDADSVVNVEQAHASMEKAGERPVAATWDDKPDKAVHYDMADRVMRYLLGTDHAHPSPHAGPSPSSSAARVRAHEMIEGERGRRGDATHISAPTLSSRASRKLLSASMDWSAFSEEQDLYKDLYNEVTGPTAEQVRRQERAKVHQDVHALQGLLSSAAQAHRR